MTVTEKIKKIAGILWRDNRKQLLWEIGGIGLLMATNGLQTCFPKMLIETLETAAFRRVVWVVIAFGLGQLLLQSLSHAVAFAKCKTGAAFDLKMTDRLAKAASRSDYEKYTSFTFRENLHFAHKCLQDRCMQTVVESAFAILGDLLAILLLLYVVSFSTWWIWLLVALSIGITGVCETVRANYNFKSYRRQSENDLRMRYARDRLTWREYAKEARLFHMYDYVTHTANYYIDLLADMQKLRAKKAFSLHLVLYIFDFLQRIAVFAFVAYQLYIQAISVADFSMLTVAIMSIFALNTSIATNFVRIYDAAKYVSALLEVLSVPERVDAAPLSLPPAFTIRFDRVDFAYPDQKERALKDLSCTLKSHRIYGIVGENGSGKTTFVHLLMGLFKPSGGTIYLNDADVSGMDTDTYYQLFSPVFQDYNMYAYSAAENVAMFSGASPAIREKMNEFGFSGLPMDAHIGSAYEQGIELSGGEAQKIAILRAIHKDAPIFILDEPTSALSAQGEFELYERLRNEFRGKTVFFISHRLASCRLCDEILVFEKGSISERGNHETLMRAQGVYAKMFRAQASLYNTDAVKETL